MGARCPRWGGGPSVGVRKARGRGAAGRSPGVRQVSEPVLARRSVEDPFSDWGRAGCDKFVPVLGGNGTKIAPTGDIFDQPRGQMR